MAKVNKESGNKGDSPLKIKENVNRSLVIKAYSEGIKDQDELQDLKNEFAAKYSISTPSNVELIKAYRELIEEGLLKDEKEFWKLIRKRAIRSLAGIANITVITKAYPCPGKCIFCPTEPRMPKSYLSNEPAIMRAILNDFDAYKQTMNRLESLQKTGHKTDKIDVIISGGTFSFYPKKYQNDFVRGVYNALNYPLPKSRSLKEAQDINEKTENRCIGLSIETRPDHITEEEVKRLRNLGCTKIEIGVQSLDDEVLALNRRGHGIAETQKAFQLIKDAGYKLNAHMMPNLYGSTAEKDIRDMKELFDNPAYKPDWIKVYPCMVVPWSQLEGIYKQGKFKPYDDETLINLLVELSGIFPEYVRVTRMYRDIPAPTILAGSKISNIRQLVETRMVERGLRSRDIRSREVRDGKVNIEDLKLNVKEFEASGGKEFFLSFDHEGLDKICGLLRLRFHSYDLAGKPHFIEELNGAALIRELHVYGEQVAIADKEKGVSQHIGLGRRLMAKAEEIAKGAGYKKIAVISGIGVREYYRKLGYRLEGTYMVKEL